MTALADKKIGFIGAGNMASALIGGLLKSYLVDKDAVIASDVEYGDTAWASYQGQPVAVGVYKTGELHPSRVFQL